MSKNRVLNGVDVEKLSAAMDDMKQNPAHARLTHRAHNKWIDGANARTVIKNFSLGGQNFSHSKPFTLESDEPASLVGQDLGPSATEALLYALASCLNTTFIYYAAIRDVKVEELELDLEGEIDLRGLLDKSDQVRNGYEEIRITFKIKSDAPRQQIEELIQTAQRHSPVFDMVSNKTPVSARLEFSPPSKEQAA